MACVDQRSDERQGGRGTHPGSVSAGHFVKNARDQRLSFRPVDSDFALEGTSQMGAKPTIRAKLESNRGFDLLIRKPRSPIRNFWNPSRHQQVQATRRGARHYNSNLEPLRR